MNNSSYAPLLKQAGSLLSDESDAIANAANLSSLIFNHVDGVNWAGFYFFRQDELVLGPFCGQVACTRIPIGRGVCGTAYQEQTTIIVGDVHKFEGHIACDVNSNSEIVVPFFSTHLSGVLDIDSPHIDRFEEQEKDFFESIAQIYLNSLQIHSSG